MKLLFPLTVLTTFWSVLALADIIHVPQDQPTIQAGIIAAVNGDAVLIDDSTYCENINFKGKANTVASRFLIDRDSSNITNTTIDGNRPGHSDGGSVVYFVF